MSTGDRLVFDTSVKPLPTIGISPPPAHTVSFFSGEEETLRIAKDGFYVRGVKVPADAKEAEEVYNAFKQWMVWQGLTNA